MIRSIAIDYTVLNRCQMILAIQDIVNSQWIVAERLDIRLLVVEKRHTTMAHASELIKLLSIEISRKNDGAFRLDIGVNPISKEIDLRQSYAGFLIGQMGVEENAPASILQVKAEATEGARLAISREQRGKFGEMHGITGEDGRTVHASVEIHSGDE